MFYRTVLSLSISSLLCQHVFANQPQNTSSIESVTVIGVESSSGANIGGTPLKALPLNAHVVGRAEIERLKFVDPDELLDRIPGETQVRNLRIPDGSKSYTIPMVDGMPLESPMEGATQRLDRVNTSDIERVEVIKGPTSAIYPNNAFGGVVNVVTRSIPEENEVRLWAEAGNFDRARAGISAAGSLDQFGYFIDVNTRSLNGLREEARNDRDQFSAKVLYRPSVNTNLLARIEHLEEDTNVRGDLTAEEISEDRRQPGGLSSLEQFEQDAIFLKLEQSFEHGQLDASVVHRKKDTIGASRFGGPRDERDTGNSAKIMYRQNLSDIGDNPTHIITGAEFYRGDVDLHTYARDDLDLAGDFTASDSQLEIDAFFLQFSQNLSQKLTLSLGARYEGLEMDSSLYDETASFDFVAPKFGLSYKSSDNNTLWFSWSRGFLAPDTGDLFNADTGNPNLDAEESENIEIGLRSQIGKWNIDSSIYQNEISNFLVTQEFVENGVEFELTTNAGLVKVQGVESVLEFDPDSIWRVGITHTYARNVYERFETSDGDFSGNTVNRSPRHHLNARLAVEPINNFIAELESDLYSSYYSDIANSPEGKFTRDERINLRLSYSKNNWKLWFNALNLTDTLEDRATYSRGTLRFRTVDGRSYYLGTSIQF